MVNDDNNELVTQTLQRAADRETAAQTGASSSGGSRAEIERFWSALQVRERITLRDLHSSGGIGEVWRAFDEVLGREVALKRLRHDKADSDIHRARFLREARLTGQLDHPGIVPVYDYAASDDGRHCFYTMRFLQGRTLSEVIAGFHQARREQGTALVSSEFLDLLGYFTSICNTVAFAHARGIVHRDLKPDNVIVGDYGEVIVLDWGLAKLVDDPAEPEGQLEPGARGRAPDRAARAGEGETEAGDPDTLSNPAIVEASMTLQGELLGTPAYMAPEQALGWIDRIDPRTDVYALAAILYEILTGEPPFRGRKLDALIEAVVDESPVPPSDKLPGVPPALEAVCLRGLAKRQTDRPESAAALAAEVRRWLSELAERKRSEQERERFFDLSLDLLAIVDRDGRLRQSNRSWATLLGRDEAQRCGRRLAELVADDCEAALAEALAAVGPEREQAEVEVCMLGDAGRPNCWIHWNLRWMPDEQTIYLVGRDVSERRSREREVEGLLESAPDASCVIDADGTIVRVNAQLERMFGYPRAELQGQAVEILVPTPLRERHRGHVRRYLEHPAIRPMGLALNLQGQRRDGSTFAVEISLSPVQTDDRLLVACTLRDADVRRKAERQMLAVLEAAPDAMLVVDADQRIRLSNRRTEELLGYARAELDGQPLDTLVPERDRERHREHVRRYLADPSPRTMGEGRTLVALHRDGREVPVEISLSPVPTEDGLLVCAAIRVRG